MAHTCNRPYQGVVLTNIVQAIQWAIAQNVDIISMSFAVQEDFEPMEIQVQAAAGKGIVQLCSTHDEGSNVEKAYPASYSQTITIAACNEFGGLPHRTPPKGFQYRVRGTDISTGAVPFLNSDENISGSSVATAIAAGLTSLILSCHRLANPGLQENDVWRKRVIETHIGKMLSGPGSDYILMERFCGMNDREGPMDV